MPPRLSTRSACRLGRGHRASRVALLWHASSTILDYDRELGSSQLTKNPIVPAPPACLNALFSRFLDETVETDLHRARNGHVAAMAVDFHRLPVRCCMLGDGQVDDYRQRGSTSISGSIRPFEIVRMSRSASSSTSPKVSSCWLRCAAVLARRTCSMRNAARLTI